MRVVSGEAMRYGLRQGDANGKCMKNVSSENEKIRRGEDGLNYGESIHLPPDVKPKNRRRGSCRP